MVAMEEREDGEEREEMEERKRRKGRRVRDELMHGGLLKPQECEGLMDDQTLAAFVKVAVQQ